MSLKRKSLWASALTGIFFLSVPTILACNNNQNLNKFFTSDIGDLKGEFNPTTQQNEQLITYVEQIKENGSDAQKALLNQKTIMITATGIINDSSFNQSSWEAISKFSQEVGNNANAYYENKVFSDANLFNAYDYAVSNNFKFWILCSFQQENTFAEWIKVAKNKERFLKNETVVVAVDWFPADDSKGPFAEIKGHILGLDFRTQDGAFITAYAAAQLLKEINAADLADPNVEDKRFPSEKTFFNTFGGNDFAGVTNFNYGFYEGLRQFNQDNITNGENYLIRTTEPIELNTGFSLTNEARAAIDRQLNNKDRPQVIFPVAGGVAAGTIDRVKEKNFNQWVIGVDTNQALAFPADQGHILTSVEKRISVAVYKALLNLYDLSYDEEKTSILKDGFHFNEQRLLVDQNGQLANFKFEGRFSDGFIRNSASTLNSNLTFVPQNAQTPITYAQRFDQIVEQKWIEFFGDPEDPTIIGRLATPIGQSTNDGKPGLKPSENVIADFNQAMQQWIDLVDPAKNPVLSAAQINANSQKVLALQNVAFGYMNKKNLQNYFEPILKIINNQKLN